MAAVLEPELRRVDRTTLAAFVSAELPRPSETELAPVWKYADDCSATCWGLVGNDGPDRMTTCMAACFGRRPPEIRALEAREQKALDYWATAEGHRLFPWVLDDVASSGLYVIVLDTTNRQSTSQADSALGSIDDGQLRRLGALLEGAPRSAKAVVVLAHHPITRISSDRLAQPVSWISIDAWKDSGYWTWALLSSQIELARLLTEDLAKSGAHPLRFFLHGHRHRFSLGDFGALRVEEAPDLPSARRGTWLVTESLDGHAFCPIDGPP